jgi:hypothetical protein
VAAAIVAAVADQLMRAMLASVMGGPGDLWKPLPFFHSQVLRYLLQDCLFQLIHAPKMAVQIYQKRQVIPLIVY